MRQYSVAKVAGDFYGLGSRLTGMTTVKARNYDDAIDQAVKKLKLRPGDTLSILALQGRSPSGRGFLPPRWQYTVT